MNQFLLNHSRETDALAERLRRVGPQTIQEMLEWLGRRFPGDKAGREKLLTELMHSRDLISHRVEGAR